MGNKIFDGDKELRNAERKEQFDMIILSIVAISLAVISAIIAIAVK